MHARLEGRNSTLVRNRETAVVPHDCGEEAEGDVDCWRPTLHPLEQGLQWGSSGDGRGWATEGWTVEERWREVKGEATGNVKVFAPGTWMGAWERHLHADGGHHRFLENAQELVAIRIGSLSPPR